MTRETWYVLEDGTAVHPGEVAPNEDGRLAHKSGLVAMRDDGETPRSRGVDVDDDGRQPFAGKGDHDKNGSTGGAAKPAAPSSPAGGTTREMRPESAAKPYKTRAAGKPRAPKKAK